MDELEREERDHYEDRIERRERHMAEAHLASQVAARPEPDDFEPLPGMGEWGIYRDGTLVWLPARWTTVSAVEVAAGRAA